MKTLKKWLETRGYSICVGDQGKYATMTKLGDNGVSIIIHRPNRTKNVVCCGENVIRRFNQRLREVENDNS